MASIQSSSSASSTHTAAAVTPARRGAVLSTDLFALLRSELSKTGAGLSVTAMASVKSAPSQPQRLTQPLQLQQTIYVVQKPSSVLASLVASFQVNLISKSSGSGMSSITISSV
jgi:hypothetical protein